jgi:hypothetical protein
MPVNSAKWWLRRSSQGPASRGRSTQFRQHSQSRVPGTATRLDIVSTNSQRSSTGTHMTFAAQKQTNHLLEECVKPDVCTTSIGTIALWCCLRKRVKACRRISHSALRGYRLVQGVVFEVAASDGYCRVGLLSLVQARTGLSDTPDRAKGRRLL